MKKEKKFRNKRRLMNTEIEKLGLDLFKTKKKFELWLNTPNFAFGGVKPIDADDELVVGEIFRISHGIFI